MDMLSVSLHGKTMSFTDLNHEQLVYTGPVLVIYQPLYIVDLHWSSIGYVYHVYMEGFMGCPLCISTS